MPLSSLWVFFCNWSQTTKGFYYLGSTTLVTFVAFLRGPYKTLFYLDLLCMCCFSSLLLDRWQSGRSYQEKYVEILNSSKVFMRVANGRACVPVFLLFFLSLQCLLTFSINDNWTEKNILFVQSISAIFFIYKKFFLIICVMSDI